MGFRIATNVQSLSAQRTLSVQKGEQNHTLEKLASGERITKSADDAAGLAISEKFKGEIRSLRQAQRNSQDAVSLVQVAEGGMNEVGNMLIRMRELSIQGATDTISDTERGFINQEVQNLKDEVERIAKTTKFANVNLLSGEGEQLTFQVGSGSNESNRITFDVGKYSSTKEALGITEISTATKEESQNNLDKLDTAISKVSEQRASFGAMQNRLQSTINNLMVYDENLSAANSRIRDADMAQETSELTKRNILTQAGVSTLAQANNNTQLALRLL